MILSRLARARRSSSTPAPGSATGSPGSRSGPSTRSAARCSARSPCCSSPGRSASRSPARGIGGITPLVRELGGPRQGRRGAARSGADGLLEAFNNVVGTSFFPRYLEPFAPERIVDGRPGDRSGCSPTPTCVGAEPQRASRSAAPTRCGRGVEGSGFLFAAGPADDQRPRRRRRRRPRGRDRRRRRSPPTVVYYDPDARRRRARRRRRRRRRRSRFDLDGRGRATAVAILGYPQDGPFDVQAGPDPRRAAAALAQHLRRRRGHPRRASRCAARSGPATPAARSCRSAGEVVGVVFAASVTDADTGYALTAEQVRESAATRASPAPEAVDTRDCAG